MCSAWPEPAKGGTYETAKSEQPIHPSNRSYLPRSAERTAQTAPCGNDPRSFACELAERWNICQGVTEGDGVFSLMRDIKGHPAMCIIGLCLG